GPDGIRPVLRVARDGSACRGSRSCRRGARDERQGGAGGGARGEPGGSLMVAILVAAPAVRWVMHETADSILAAFHAPMLADAGAESISEFDGTDEYADAVKREGIWGFTDTKTAPPTVHLWIPRD